MSNSLIFLGLFIGEVFAIYFLSHTLLTVSFHLLRKIFRSDRPIIWLMAILYLPGTILHEISHYFFALILAMNPEEVSILPRIEKNHIRLGHVLYRKHSGDFVRPIIVGIAPFFGAVGVLWITQVFGLFPGKVWWETVLFGYFILAITANMFSSKQDLVDLVYVIPIIIIIGALFYIFSIQIDAQALMSGMTHVEGFLKTLQVPLLFSIVTHGILIVIIKFILSVV